MNPRVSPLLSPPPNENHEATKFWSLSFNTVLIPAVGRCINISLGSCIRGAGTLIVSQAQRNDFPGECRIFLQAMKLWVEGSTQMLVPSLRCLRRSLLQCLATDVGNLMECIQTKSGTVKAKVNERGERLGLDIM